MGSAMQLYAGFALLVIAILAIIVIAAIVSNLIGSVRLHFGGTRARDDFSAPARPSRSATPASPAPPPAAPSDHPPNSR